MHLPRYIRRRLHSLLTITICECFSTSPSATTTRVKDTACACRLHTARLCLSLRCCPSMLGKLSFESRACARTRGNLEPRLHQRPNIAIRRAKRQDDVRRARPSERKVSHPRPPAGLSSCDTPPCHLSTWARVGLGAPRLIPRDAMHLRQRPSA